MELIVFDLDGTLLDATSQVSAHTRDTLQRLRQRGIAYTVATGRTLHAARDLLQDHAFILPHIYKNGVVVWRPDSDHYSHSNLLTSHEIACVVDSFRSVAVTPFVFTLESRNRNLVYHSTMLNDVERRLAALFTRDRGLQLLPLAELPVAAQITNVSALGPCEAIAAVVQMIRGEEHLVAYAGNALEGNGLHWVDIHHSAASKGSAVAQLRQDLGVSRVICFGDSDNDLSMFAVADESYAPSNAKEEVKRAATAVIGHHDQDGISQFLRERFDL